MPWDAIGNLVLGLWKSHKVEKWVRAWMSLIISALLTFLFVWGTSIVSLYSKLGATGALVVGFGSALIMTSAAILMIVRRTEQFKNVALWFPTKIEEAAGDILEKYGTEFDPNLQKENK
jgi:hypothetical protein